MAIQQYRCPAGLQIVLWHWKDQCYRESEDIVQEAGGVFCEPRHKQDGTLCGPWCAPAYQRGRGNLIGTARTVNGQSVEDEGKTPAPAKDGPSSSCVTALFGSMDKVNWIEIPLTRAIDGVADLKHPHPYRYVEGRELTGQERVLYSAEYEIEKG